MWFSLSILTAVFVSIADAISKKVLQTRRSETVALIRSGWTSLFLLALMPWSVGPSVPSQFWRPVILGIPLEIVAALAFNRALQIAPLSLVIPYMAFTPVFLVVGAWLFLGQKISAGGGVGIGLVAMGAILLQAPLLEAGPSRWKRFIPHERASLLMLGVAFIYAFTSVLAKQAVEASSPLFFCGTYFPLFALGLIPFQLKSGDKIASVINRPGIFLLIGGFDAATLVAQFTAFQMAQVAYVVALKRLSLLLSVAWGWIFFREQKSWTRLAGAVMMAAGAGLIALR